MTNRPPVTAFEAAQKPAIRQQLVRATVIAVIAGAATVQLADGSVLANQPVAGGSPRRGDSVLIERRGAKWMVLGGAGTDSQTQALLPAVQAGLTGAGAPSPHELAGAHHIGTVSDSQGPQFLKMDGSRMLTGNLAVAAGVTIDGYEISTTFDSVLAAQTSLTNSLSSHLSANINTAHSGLLDWARVNKTGSNLNDLESLSLGYARAIQLGPYEHVWRPTVLIGNTYVGILGPVSTYNAKLSGSSWLTLQGGYASALGHAEGRLLFAVSGFHTDEDQAITWSPVIETYPDKSVQFYGDALFSKEPANIGVGGSYGGLRMFHHGATGTSGIGSNLYYDGSNWVYPLPAGYGGQGMAWNIYPSTGALLVYANNGANPATVSTLFSVSNTGNVSAIGAGTFGGNANTTQFTIKAHASQSPANALLGFYNSSNSELAGIRFPNDSNLHFGQFSGHLTTTGVYNTAFGFAAMRYVTSGSNNSAFGLNALIGLTQGIANAAFGQSALGATTIENYSTAVGYAALAQSTASHQTGVGALVLYNTTTGYYNTAVGYAGLFANVTGYYNVAVGMFAGYQGANLVGNVLAGYQAGFSGAGFYNVAIGYGALYLAAGTSSNVALGTNALHENVSGNQSIAIGHDAGFSSLGSGNVFIGTSSGYYETGSNVLYIENSASATPLIIGNFAADRVGINLALASLTDTFNVGGSASFAGVVRPSTSYSRDLGELTRKWRSIHAAELWVETLVAADVMATMGGRLAVAPTTTLIADVTTGATTIDVKHNNLPTTDFVRLESNGNVEWMFVNGGPTAITGGYRYPVLRDQDGSGANAWLAGDAVLNTEIGFIDIYSVHGIPRAGQSSTFRKGPTMVGNVRVDNFYHDSLQERWALGNLEGLFNYAPGDVFGFAAGDPTATYITAEATNGFRVVRGATVLGQWDTAGTITVGDAAGRHVRITASDVLLRTGTTELIKIDGTPSVTVGRVAASQSNVYIAAGSLALRNNTTNTVLIDASGAVTVGEVAASKSNILISAGALKLRNNLTDIITLATTGAATFGEIANSRSRVEIVTGVVSLINRNAGGVDSTQIQLDSAGKAIFGEVANSRSRIEFAAGVASFINRNASGVDATALQFLSVPDAGTGAIARIAGVVDIGASGGIWQGSAGSFASPSTGYKLYQSGSKGVWETWLSGTKQVYIDPATMALVAGAGAVKISESGIRISSLLGQWTVGSLEWRNPSTNALALSMGTIVSGGVVTGSYIDCPIGNLSLSGNNVSVTNSLFVSGNISGVTAAFSASVTFNGGLNVATGPFNVTGAGAFTGAVTVGSLSAGAGTVTVGSLLFNTDNAADIGASSANRPRDAYIAGITNTGKLRIGAADHTFTTTQSLAANTFVTAFAGGVLAHRAVYIVTITASATSSPWEASMAGLIMTANTNGTGTDSADGSFTATHLGGSGNFTLRPQPVTGGGVGAVQFSATAAWPAGTVFTVKAYRII